MRHNQRPVLAVSALLPATVSLPAGDRPMILCPDGCGRWPSVRRGLLWPHRAADGRSRCVGSGQRIRIDLTPAEHAARQHAAERSADYRRPTRTRIVAAAPIAPAVCRMRNAA